MNFSLMDGGELAVEKIRAELQLMRNGTALKREREEKEMLLSANQSLMERLTRAEMALEHATSLRPEDMRESEQRMRRVHNVEHELDTLHIKAKRLRDQRDQARSEMIESRLQRDQSRSELTESRLQQDRLRRELIEAGEKLELERMEKRAMRLERDKAIKTHTDCRVELIESIRRNDLLQEDHLKSKTEIDRLQSLLDNMKEDNQKMQSLLDNMKQDNQKMGINLEMTKVEMASVQLNNMILSKQLKEAMSKLKESEAVINNFTPSHSFRQQRAIKLEEQLKETRCSINTINTINTSRREKMFMMDKSVKKSSMTEIATTSTSCPIPKSILKRSRSSIEQDEAELLESLPSPPKDPEMKRRPPPIDQMDHRRSKHSSSSPRTDQSTVSRTDQPTVPKAGSSDLENAVIGAASQLREHLSELIREIAMEMMTRTVSGKHLIVVREEETMEDKNFRPMMEAVNTDLKKMVDKQFVACLPILSQIMWRAVKELYTLYTMMLNKASIEHRRLEMERNEHRHAIARIQDEHQQAITRFQGEHQHVITCIQADSDEKRKEANRRLEMERGEHRHVIARIQADLEKERDEHRHFITRIQADSDEKGKEANRRFDSLKRRLRDEQKKLNGISSAHSALEKKLDEEKSKSDNLTLGLTTIREQLTIQMEVNKNLQQNLVDKTNELDNLQKQSSEQIADAVDNARRLEDEVDNARRLEEKVTRQIADATGNTRRLEDEVTQLSTEKKLSDKLCEAGKEMIQRCKQKIDELQTVHSTLERQNEELTRQLDVEKRRVIEAEKLLEKQNEELTGQLDVEKRRVVEAEKLLEKQDDQLKKAIEEIEKTMVNRLLAKQEPSSSTPSTSEVNPQLMDVVPIVKPGSERFRRENHRLNDELRELQKERHLRLAAEKRWNDYWEQQRHWLNPAVMTGESSTG